MRCHGCRVPYNRGWQWAAAVGRTESSAPTDGLPMPFSIYPPLAVSVTWVGGTHSASDTPRRMSGMWSQCPWGSPALRRGVVALLYLSNLGGRWWRDRAEQSPAPMEGLRFFTGFALSPPHPSRPEAVTPSPQGEGGAVCCFRLPFNRHVGWLSPGVAGHVGRALRG